NRLTNRWSKVKGNTAYSYDNDGNLTFINYPTSTDITLQYDANNRLTNMVDAAGVTKYTYYAGGLLNTEDGPWSSDTVTYGYNSANAVLDKSEYLYNTANQRIRLTRTDGSYYNNSYDNIGQLVWADSTVASEDRGYLYDAAWNLNVRTNNGVTSTFVVDNKNQI